MRKGYVMIICRDSKQKEYLFDYISYQLKNNIERRSKNKISDYFIKINRYTLLFKSSYPQNMRGYRPEIVYIDKWADISIDDVYNLIEAKVVYSNRKTPIRYGRLNDGMMIDLQELIDDDYARNNTCDIGKVKEWEEKYE